MLKLYDHKSYLITDVKGGLASYKCNFCKAGILKKSQFIGKNNEFFYSIKTITLDKFPSKKEIKEKHFCGQGSTCQKEYKELYDED